MNNTELLYQLMKMCYVQKEDEYGGVDWILDKNRVKLIQIVSDKIKESEKEHERKKMKNRSKLINTLIDSSNEELVNFLDYDVLRDYVCGEYYCCKDCYFANQISQCIFPHIDTFEGKKLIAEWLRREEDETKTN